MKIKTRLSWMSFYALGAGSMYLLDPDNGHRRRVILRDRAFHFLRKAGIALNILVRDVAYRLKGALFEARSRLPHLHEEEVSDDVLVARVRSYMGRLVSHPHAVEVSAQDGKITLGGPILHNEVDMLLRKLSSLPGVKHIENKFKIYETADGIPSLQGGRITFGGKVIKMFRHENWSPTERLVGSVVGGLLIYNGFKRRGMLGISVGSLGMGILARSVTNVGMRRLTRVRPHLLKAPQVEEVAPYKKVG